MTSVQHGNPQLPLTGETWSNENEATTTCGCGAVQMVVPLKAPGLVNTFVCHCTDCRKWSASMFATNFTTLDSHTRYVKGEDNLVMWAEDSTTSSHKRMTNAFCKTCGMLIWRQGAIAPGTKFMRGGPVDDQSLHNTVLKPQVEIFSENRAAWVSQVEGAKQNIGMGDFGQ